MFLSNGNFVSTNETYVSNKQYNLQCVNCDPLESKQELFVPNVNGTAVPQQLGTAVPPTKTGPSGPSPLVQADVCAQQMAFGDFHHPIVSGQRLLLKEGNLYTPSRWKNARRNARKKLIAKAPLGATTFVFKPDTPYTQQIVLKYGASGKYTGLCEVNGRAYTYYIPKPTSGFYHCKRIRQIFPYHGVCMFCRSPFTCSSNSFKQRGIAEQGIHLRRKEKRFANKAISKTSFPSAQVEGLNIPGVAWLKDCFGLDGFDLIEGGSLLTSMISSIVAWQSAGSKASLVAAAASAVGLCSFVARKILERDTQVVVNETEHGWPDHLLQIEDVFADVIAQVDGGAEVQAGLFGTYGDKMPPILRKILSCTTVAVVALCGVYVMERFPSIDRITKSINNLTMLASRTIPALDKYSDYISAILFGEEDSAVKLTNSYLEIIDKAHKFMDLEVSRVGCFPWALARGIDTHAELLSILGAADKRHSLHGVMSILSGQVSVRIRELRNALRSQQTRQVPTALIFHGRPGIGKTRAKDALATLIANRRYGGGEELIYNFDCGSKYWPSYSGQPIANCQEFMKNKVLTDDLLVRDLTSIVSNGAYNMQGAGVEDKMQTWHATTLLVDGNLHPKEIAKRVAEILSPDSIEAFMERLTFVYCSWALDPEELKKAREERPFDRSGEFSHLHFFIGKWDHKTNTTYYLPKAVLFGAMETQQFVEQANGIIQQIMPTSERCVTLLDYDRTMRSLYGSPAFKVVTDTLNAANFGWETALSFTELEMVERKMFLQHALNAHGKVALAADGKYLLEDLKEGPEAVVESGAHHMVVNIHGPVGCGKTSSIVASIISYFGPMVMFKDKIFKYDTQLVNNKRICRNAPVLLICDDILASPTPEAEDAFVQVYNSLHPGSLVIFVSNHIPTFKRRGWVFKDYVQTLPFSIPATYRRAGYNGTFEIPNNPITTLTNKYCYSVNSANVLVEGESLTGGAFARYLFSEWCGYAKINFDFSHVQVLKMPQAEGTPICISAPTLDAMKQDVANMTSLGQVLMGAASTTISLSATDRSIISNNWRCFELLGVPRGTPLEIVKAYGQNLRSMGITSDIRCTISDLGDMLIKGYTIYTVLSEESLSPNMLFDEKTRTAVINGDTFNFEQLCSIAFNTSSVNLMNNKPDLTSIERGRIIQFLSSAENIGDARLFLESNIVDPGAQYLIPQEHMGWKKILLISAAAVASFAAVGILISSLMPSASHELVTSTVKNVVEGRTRLEDVAPYIKEDPVWSEVYGDACVEAKYRKRAKAHFGDSTSDETGTARKEKAIIALGEERAGVIIDRINRQYELDVKAGGQWPSAREYNDYVALRLRDEYERNGGREWRYEMYTKNDETNVDRYEDFYRFNILPNLVRVSGLVFGLMITKDLCIAPHHIFTLSPDIFIEHEVCGVMKQFKASVVRNYHARDLVLLKVHKAPAFKDIRHHFADRNCLVPTANATLLLPRGKQLIAVHGIVISHAQRPDSYGDISMPISYTDWSNVYIGCRMSRKGDCGSPYVTMMNGIIRIAGLHTASTDKTVMAACITFDDFKDGTLVPALAESTNSVNVIESSLNTENVEYSIVHPIIFEECSDNGNECRVRCELITSHLPTLTLTRYIEECQKLLRPRIGEPPNIDLYPLSGPRIKRIRSLEFDASLLKKEKVFINRCFYDQAVRHLGASPCIPIIPSGSSKLENFSDLDRDSRGRRSQIMTNVKHLENSFAVAMDPLVRSHVVEEMSLYLEDTMIDTMHFLDWHTTINGFVDGEVVLKNSDMSSASGFFAKHIMKLSAKKMFFEQVEQNNNDRVWVLKDTPEARALKSLYEFSLARLMKGEAPPHLFTTTKKIELLPIEKAHKGRVFETPNCEFSFCERTILGHFIAKLSSWDAHSAVSVGMNDTSNWAVLASLHANFDYHGAIDYVKWDKYLPYEIAEMFINSLERIGDRNPEKREWINAACTLVNTLFNSNRAIGNTIYTIRGSMPSGSFTTAALNSLLNFYIDYYVFTSLCGMHSYSSFTTQMKCSNYGDDKLVSWNKNISMGMNAYKEIVEGHLGMRVDSDKKDGVIVDKTPDLSETTFLSRSFVLDPQLGWIGALKRSGIVKSFYHTRKHLEDVQHVQELFDKGFAEIARCGSNEYGRLVKLLMAVKKEFPQYRDLKVAMSFDLQKAQLFMEIKGLNTRYLKATVEMNSEAYNTPAVASNNHLAMQEHNTSPAMRLVMPHDGMAQANMIVQPTMMMNNAQLVDDKNDTTACPLVTLPLMQSLPSAFSMSIWTGHFTANHFIARTNVGAETPIGTIIFNYSSDVRSNDFPSQSSAMALTKNIISGHDYYVTDFLVKVKLVSATGTIGRLLVAVIPANFALEDPTNDITTAIKESGYDYSEISANGDSTYTLSLRPYVNAGLASHTQQSGAGDLVEAVRAICVVSETFGTTFSEQAPNLTITTEFAFGEGFAMGVPNTTLRRLLAPPPANNNKSNIIAAKIPRGFRVGSDLVVRVGTKRYNSLVDVTNTSCDQLPELTGFDTPFLNPSDAYQLLPASTGFTPLFMRGSPTLRLGTRPTPQPGDTMLTYMLRWISETDEDVETMVLLNAAGEKGIPLTFSSDPPRTMFRRNGYTFRSGTDTVTSDYVFRVLVVRGSSYSGTFVWCEFPNVEPTVRDLSWDPATTPYLKVEQTADNDNFICSCAPALVPRYGAHLTDLSIGINVAGGKDLGLNPQTNTNKEKLDVIIGSVFSKRITDNVYPCMTLTRAAFTTNATTGTNAIPAEEQAGLINYVTRLGYTANFDLVTADNTLVAHCFVNPTGMIYVNLGAENMYREISGDLYVVNLQQATGGEVQATPNSSWHSYVAPTGLRRRKPCARIEMMMAGAAIAGGLGGLVNQGNVEADREQRYKLADKEHEEQTLLATMNNEGMMERLKAGGQLTMEQMAQMYQNNSLLSTQSAEQAKALDKQKYAQSMVMQGLRDPSQANKINSQIGALQGGNPVFESRGDRIIPGSKPGMSSKTAIGKFDMGRPLQNNRLMVNLPPPSYSKAMEAASQYGALPTSDRNVNRIAETPFNSRDSFGTPVRTDVTASSAAQTLNRMQPPPRATLGSMRSAAQARGSVNQAFEMRPMGGSMSSMTGPLRGLGAASSMSGASTARLAATALI